MASPGPFSALGPSFCTTPFLIPVVYACQAHSFESESSGTRQMHLDTYYDCNATELRLSSSQQAFVTGPLTTILLPTIYTIVLLIGLPANGLAIWVLAVKIKKVPSTLFLLNLATADLFFILVLPFKISYHFLGNNWLFGEALCRMVTAFFYVNMYCSILFLACISIDRFFSLVYPFKAKGSRRWRKSLFISLGIWAMVVAALIPFLLIRQTVSFQNSDITTCHDITPVCAKEDWLFYYLLGLALLGFAVPFVVVVFCYGSVLVTLMSKRRNHSRVTWLLLLVLVTFLLCFTPSNFLLIYQRMNHSLERNNQLYIWYTIALALGAFSSCIDPFIYYFTSRDFRDLVKAAVCYEKKSYSGSSGKTSDQLLQKKPTLTSQ